MTEATPQARIRQLELEKTRLADEIDVLKDALADHGAILPVEWHLTPMEARVFRVLLKREVASRDALMAALYSDRIATPDPIIISAFVSKMRKKLKPFGINITVVWTVGYALDAETQARLKSQEKQAA